MSEARRLSVQKKRACLAVLVAGAIVLVPAFWGAAENAPTQDVGVPQVQLVQLADNGSPDAILDALSEKLYAESTVLPAEFSEEAGVLPSARDIRVSSDGMVVGFVVDDKAEPALAALQELFEGKGWTAVSLGGVDGFTFVKSEGFHKWMLATATEMGASTSVVIRSARI